MQAAIQIVVGRCPFCGKTFRQERVMANGSAKPKTPPHAEEGLYTMCEGKGMTLSPLGWNRPLLRDVRRQVLRTGF